MLVELHVTNFALIDHLDLSFGAGLNILTGETGAGKSIIIDALGLALGERAGHDLVRTGAGKATVEAVFDLKHAPAEMRQKLADAGLSEDDGGEDGDTLFVARELAKGGKSSCRINGRLMPVAVLKEIAEGLVDVHGQHEHQSLLAADRHIDILVSTAPAPETERSVCVASRRHPAPKCRVAPRPDCLGVFLDFRPEK